MSSIKNSKKIILTVFFGLLTTHYVAGQTKITGTQNEIVFGINSERLWGKESELKEIAEERQKIEAELQSKNIELGKLADEIEKLGLEIKSIAERLQKFPGACPSESFLNDFKGKINRYYEFSYNYFQKEREISNSYKSKEKELISPIKEKIQKLIIQFANERNHKLILDTATINEQLVINHLDIKDITDEFIAFYKTHSKENK